MGLTRYLSPWKFRYIQNIEIFRIPLILFAKGTNFNFQAKEEKQALELGERMPNKPVDIIAEVYQKIRVPSDNIYESKLVEIEIYKVSLLQSCPTLKLRFKKRVLNQRWFIATK